MKGKSCLSNLIFFYDRVTCLDEEKAVDLIFLDFSMAFDTIPRILLDKCSYCEQVHVTLGDELSEGQNLKS